MERKQQLKNIIAKVREANTLDKRSFERAELEKKVLEILNKHIRVEGAEGDELYIDDFKDIIKEITSLFEQELINFFIYFHASKEGAEEIVDEYLKLNGTFQTSPTKLDQQ